MQLLIGRFTAFDRCKEGSGARPDAWVTETVFAPEPLMVRPSSSSCSVASFCSEVIIAVVFISWLYVFAHVGT